MATPAATSARRLPAGTPAWITPSLVDETLRVWQPLSREPLSEADAIDMLINVGRLADALAKPTPRASNATTRE